MAFFTEEHFSLLQQWNGTHMDSTSEDHQNAYAALKTAYDITGHWAEAVASRIGPGAYVKIRRRPTNQAGNFSSYNWAKIYPSPSSPTNLAYTVGIDAAQVFLVKIDTVGNPPQQQAYAAIRGNDDAASPRPRTCSLCRHL